MNCIVVENEQELLKYLMRGYILTCSSGKRYFSFELGRICFCCDNSFYPIDININELYILYTEYWRLIKIKKNWWTDIPKEGIWCWVSNLNWEDKKRIERIVSCLEVSEYYSFKSELDSYKYATPLTKENCNEIIHW
ncbi:MAG: hypothetical protein WC679_02405 [Bacteroidales bacterium]|jgi:hypothetical protein